MRSLNVLLILALGLVSSCSMFGSRGRSGTAEAPWSGTWVALSDPAHPGGASGTTSVQLEIRTEEDGEVQVELRSAPATGFLSKGSEIFENAPAVRSELIVQRDIALLQPATTPAEQRGPTSIDLYLYDAVEDRLLGIDLDRQRSAALQSLGRPAGVIPRLVLAFERVEEAEDTVEGWLEFSKRKSFGSNRRAPLAHLLLPDLPDLDEWAEPIADLVAPTGGVRAGAPLAWSVARVFADPYFDDAFGDSFHELSQKDLEHIHGALQELPADSLARQLSPFFSSEPSRSRGRDASQNPRSMLTTRLAAQSLSNWLSTAEEKLGALQPRATDEAMLRDVSGVVASPLALAVLSGDEERDLVRRTSGDALARAIEDRLRDGVEELERKDLGPAARTTIVTWRTQHQSELQLVSRLPGSDLNSRLDRMQDRAVKDLLAFYEESAESIGDDFGALARGVTWYGAIRGTLEDDMNRPEARALVERTLATRPDLLTRHADQLEQELAQPFRRLPALPAPDSDFLRRRVIEDSGPRLARFTIAELDRASPVHNHLRSIRKSLLNEQLSLLPPSFRPYQPSLLDGPGPEALSQQWRNDSPPLTAPGIPLDNETMWALFHGRFDRFGHFQEQEALSLAKGLQDIIGADFDFKYAHIVWVQQCAQRFGDDQLGNPTQRRWVKFVNGEVVEDLSRLFWVPLGLESFYATHFKQLNEVSLIDVILGDLSRQDAESLMSMLQRFKVQPDGTVILETDWARAINRSLEQCLDAWPARARAHWQIQENMRRRLQGRPSLQAEWGWS